MRRSKVIQRGPLDFAVWTALLGAFVGLASAPDHFTLVTMVKFVGVFAVGGGLLGLIGGLLAVRSGSGES